MCYCVGNEQGEYMSNIDKVLSERLVAEYTRRGMHAEAAFERLGQFKSDHKRLQANDVMRLFTQRCIDKERSTWIYHTIYDCA